MASQTASLNKLEDTLELYLVKKAPSLPKNIKQVIVNFAPWITIILMIIAIPAVLLVLGLGAIVAPFSVLMGPAATASYGFTYLVSMLILAVTIILELMAIPGLFAKSKRGWRLVYYATLVGFISNLFNPLNLIGSIISTLIGLYFLFQIKEYYK